MTVNIQATANFKSMLDEIAKLALAYNNLEEDTQRIISRNDKLLSSLHNVEKQSRNTADGIRELALAQQALNKANGAAERIKNPRERAPRAPNTNPVPKTGEGVDKINTSFERYIELSSFVKGSNVKLALSFFQLNKQLLETAGSVRSIRGDFNNFSSSSENFSTNMKKIGDSSSDMGKGVEEGGIRLSRLSLSFSSFVRLGIVNLATRAISSFTSSVKESVGVAIDYEKKIGAIRAISQDAPLDFDRWAKSIRNVSSEFNLDLLDATEAAYQAISNQIVKGADTFDFLALSAKLALTAQGSLTQAVDATSSVLKSYNKSLFEAQDVSDKLFKTTELGRIKLSDIGTTIGTVTVIAHEAGISFEEVAASLATMTVQGVSPANAITFLRNAILNILKPTEAMKKAVQELGFATPEAAVQILGFGNFLAQLTENTKGTTSEMVELFGTIRGAQGALTTGTDSLKLYNKNLDGITNAALTAGKAFDLATESIGNKFSKQVNETKNNFVAFIEAVGKEVFPLIESLGGLANITQKFGIALAGLAIFGTFSALVKLSSIIIATTANSALLNTAVLELTAQQVLLGDASLVTSGKLLILNSTLSSVVVGVGRLLVAYAPLLLTVGAAYAGYLLLSKGINDANDAFDAQTAVAEKVHKQVESITQKQLDTILGYYDRLGKARIKSTGEADRENIKQLASLKETIDKSEKKYKELNTAKLENSKVLVKSLEEEKKKIQETLKITDEFINKTKEARDKLNDEIFGESFTAKINIDSSRTNFKDSVVSGIAEEIIAATDDLKNNLQSLIASSKDESFTTQLKKELASVLSESQKSLKAIRDESLDQELKNLKKLSDAKNEENRRSQAQEILNRSNSVDVLKATSEKEALSQGGIRLSELQRAQSLVSSLGDKKVISDLIADITKVTNEKVLELRNQATQDNLRELIAKSKEQIQEFKASLSKELQDFNASNLLAKNINEFLSPTKGSVNAKQSIVDALVAPKKGLTVGENRQRANQSPAELEAETEAILKPLLVVADKIGNGLSVTNDELEAYRKALNSTELSSVKFSESTQKVFNDIKAATFNFDKTSVDNLTSFNKTTTEVTGYLAVVNDTNKAVEKLKDTEKDLGKNNFLEQIFGTKSKIIDLNAQDNKTGIDKAVQDATLKNQLETSTTEGVESGAVKGIGSGLFETSLTDIVNGVFESVLGGFTGQFTGKSETPSSDKAIQAQKKLQEQRDANLAKEEARRQALIDAAANNGRVITPSSTNTIIAEEEVRLAKEQVEKSKRAIIDGGDKISAAQKEVLEVDLSVRKKQLANAKKDLAIAESKDLTTAEGRGNKFIEEQSPFAEKTKSVSQDVDQFGKVLQGTSKTISLQSIKQFQAENKTFVAAIDAVQGFTNALLEGKKKGLTSQQKFGTILSQGAAGATAGSTFGPVGTIIGAGVGVGLGLYQVYEKGGLVYRAQGGIMGAPKGSDTVPSMLTKGEYVMNRSATDKFYSQIKAMNGYSRFSEGGKVQNSSVNVGDIHVNGSMGGQSTATDVRGIGNAIRREIKRGRLGSF